jgi:hypothetical protein
MPYKESSKCYRDGGKWVCWCDGLDMELTLRIVESIRACGFSVKREGDIVFVLQSDVDKIDSNDTLKIIKGKE